jgi:hypothetical protein
MIIQTSRVYVAPIRTKIDSQLTDFVKSNNHQIAMTGAIGKAIGLRPDVSVKIDSGETLHAVPTASRKLTAEQRLAIEKAAVTFGTSTLPILKNYVPQLTGPIDGIEVVFASKTAFDAWADPERTSVVKPLIKTTRALFEIVDVAQTAIPALKQVPYLDAVGVFVKVGDSVIQLWTDVSKAVGSSATK